MNGVRPVLRAGLALLAVLQGTAGAVQLLFPREFYDHAPVPGHPWVATLPPFNEHLMRDLGAATLAFVLVLAVAAVVPEPRLVRTALAANIAFTAPHFAFHATHLEHVPPGDAVVQTIALAMAVAIPAFLLAVSLRGQRARPVPED